LHEGCDFPIIIATDGISRVTSMNSKDLLYSLLLLEKPEERNFSPEELYEILTFVNSLKKISAVLFL
jgi:hypothetical protein